MKLEVGMYVRTDNGIIEKVNKIYDRHTTDNMVVWLNGYGDGKSVFIDDFEEVKYLSINTRGFIKKEPSFDIIDLVEEGDLVVIEFLLSSYKIRGKGLFEVVYKDNNDMFFANAYYKLCILKGDWSDDDKPLKPVLKSIVTKEQIEQICYEICK